MEGLLCTYSVSRRLFQAQRMVARVSADRLRTVAKVRTRSATGPRLPRRTPSPSLLLLPPLPQPLPPRSRCRCPCAASGSPLIVPAALGSQARRPQSSGNARVLAELRHWGAGGTGSGRGQRGKPGQSVRDRSRGGQLRVPELGSPLPGPSFPAGLPTRGRSPGGRPRR